MKNNFCLEIKSTVLFKIMLFYYTLYSPIVHPTGGVIYPLIGRPSSPILEEILYGRHSQDEEHRYHGHLLAKGTDFRHPVEQDDEDEVQVSHSMELLQQVLRYEREQRVLRRPYLVAHKLSIGMVPFGCLRWHRVIGHHHPIAPLLQLIGGVVIAQAEAFPPGRYFCTPECVY